MSITQWPVAERPREKLLLQGAAALSDAELLAIFLRTGVPGRTAVDLARDLLNRFGSLRQMLLADEKSFCETPGLGPAKFTQLRAMVEMARRHLLEELQRGESLSDPLQSKRYLQACLRDLPHEVFEIGRASCRERV